eukprot:UN29512
MDISALWDRDVHLLTVVFLQSVDFLSRLFEDDFWVIPLGFRWFQLLLWNLTEAIFNFYIRSWSCFISIKILLFGFPFSSLLYWLFTGII